MAERIEQTDKEQKKFIKKDTEEIKKRYKTLTDKSWSLKTRMETMSRDRVESSGSIQSNLDALLRNSINQDEAFSENNRIVRNRNSLPCRKSKKS